MRRLKYLFCMMVIAFGCVACNENVEVKKEKVILPVAEKFVPLANHSERMLHGQSVYVPVYSSLYNQYEGNIFHMTAILSIRNISSKSPIVISKVDYYDTNGKLVKSFIDRPFNLGAMASKDFVIPESDLSGGTGANFIVDWESKDNISIPIIESIMIGSIGTRGFSFTSRGKEVEAH